MFWSDYDIEGWDFLNGWGRDPEKERKKLYLTVIGLNLIANIIFYALYLFLNTGPFPKVAEALSFPTGNFTLSIALWIQIFITIFLVKNLTSWHQKLEKDSILSVLTSVNFILFMVLATIAVKNYKGMNTTYDNLGFFWTAILILSTIYLLYSAKNVVISAKDYVQEFLGNGEEEIEEEEDDEEPIEKYSWVSQFYNVNQNPYIEEDLEYFRFHSPEKVFPFLIASINATLLLEKEKLVNKDVINSSSASDAIVQIDYPVVNEQDDIEELIENDDFGFSNPYVVINNSYVAFKLRTNYLSNPKRLEQIGEEILPTQRSDSIKQVPFKPLSRLRPQDPLYEQMINGGKRSDGKVTQYTLFQNIGIQKIKNDWYVVLNYTKWYKELVTKKRLDPLPDVLEQESEGMQSIPFNPKVWFGYKSEGGYLWLDLKRIRHLLFWGQSGSGKSVFLNALIYNLIYFSKPTELQLVLIDPLKVSFRIFKKIKHLLSPVAMEEEEAIEAINNLMAENDKRYSYLEGLWYEDIYAYNKDIKNGIIKKVDEYGLTKDYALPGKTTSKNQHLEKIDKAELKELQEKRKEGYIIWEPLSQIVLIYDEFAKYMGSPLYEKAKAILKLIKLSEQARKAGIILILGTQKIDADSVPSALRENMPTRVCLKVASSFNSRAILWEQAENKSSWALLAGNGDLLIYNWEALSLQAAERAQGFFVSEDHMEELLRENFKTFGVNDFVYSDGEDNEYDWIDAFYEQEKNKAIWEKKGFDTAPMLQAITKGLNTFLESQRELLLDKESLANNKKNITVDKPDYQTEEELSTLLEELKYSNQYFNITKSFLDVKLNVKYLSNESKLYKLESENILELKLNSLAESVSFNPLKEMAPDDYEKMLREWKEYQLIGSFEIIKKKIHYYIRMNFTRYYKVAVVFPTSKTVLQILTESYGNKLESLKQGKVFVIWKGEID